MGRPSFDRARSLLEAQGTRIADWQDGGPFGSWYITLGADPPLRLVWDGRDKWLRVDWQTDKTHPLAPDFRIWESLWVCKRPANPDQALDAAIVELNAGPSASDGADGERVG